AIMAIWNAPTEDAMHADNACRGALAAYHISEDLNGEFAAKGQSIMRTRFGLHTGDVLVGNVGARPNAVHMPGIQRKPCGAY
ncbi:MAG: hypothetical protein HOA30_10220, partial [Rhodospirillaceae bacterium]|nr:hypothetical protein [Rhodospirillaceae bacterium]